MRSTDGSSHHVILSDDNGGDPARQETVCVSSQKLSVSYGNIAYVLSAAML
jgi:hypothetical protein